MIVSVLIASKATDASTSSVTSWLPILGPVVTLLIFVVTYGTGVIRPLKIKSADYYEVGEGSDRRTWLKTQVKNRQLMADRDLTGLGVFHLPPRRHRLVHLFWRRRYEDINPYVVRGRQVELMRNGELSIRHGNIKSIEVRLVHSDLEELEPGITLPADVRVAAYFGNRIALRKPYRVTVTTT